MRLTFAVVLHDGVVLIRIERRAKRVDPFETGLLEHRSELREHQLEAFAHLLVDVAVFQVRERELEAVHHRQELLDQAFSRAVDERGLLAQHALAVVLEVGLQTTSRVEQVVAFPLKCVQVGLELSGLVRRGIFVLG